MSGIGHLNIVDGADVAKCLGNWCNSVKVSVLLYKVSSSPQNIITHHRTLKVVLSYLLWEVEFLFLRLQRQGSQVGSCPSLKFCFREGVFICRQSYDLF